LRFINALTFLTIVPVLTKRPLDEADFGRATAFYPLVGAIIGVLHALLFVVVDSIWSTFTANVLIVAVWAILTGGLHLDGLSDAADGFLGGKNSEQKLAIMKDSRIGAYGVIAISLAILFKVALLGEIDGMRLMGVLILAPTLGRWSMVLLIQLYPTTSTSVMGQLVKQHSGWLELIVATGTALLAAVLLFRIWGLVILLFLAAIVAILGGLVMRRLNGLTGDIYGATCELSEIFILLFVSFVVIIEGIL
jgi:adenosylcobinamide-GDP ribazoletransferase